MRTLDYGYSFESYCTAPSDLPSEFPIPNTNVQWCSVVKTNLGGFRTIVGGEVDCVRQGADPQRIKTDDFVELKTNIAIQSQRDEVNFERCVARVSSFRFSWVPSTEQPYPSAGKSSSSTTSSPVRLSPCFPLCARRSSR